MTLYEYMVMNKLSYRKAATHFEVDHALIYKYVQGQRTPSLETALKIHKKSKGFIKLEDLFEESKGRK